MRTYCLLLLLFSQITLAQLTVRNDAFVFAKDEIVFVEDNINLAETNSTIYLREDAQLIQGVSSTGNSGLGKLSVYQEGTVNNYAYNYWSSPVGNVSANSTGNSTFVPNQNIFDVVDVTNSNIAGFTTTGYNGTSAPLNIAKYWLWKYDPGTAYSEWDFVGESGFVDAGYGFTMKGTIGASPLAGQQYDFRGKPNEGDIYTNIVDGQETLIGNPYPSALDSALLIHDPNNIPLLDGGTLYFWEQDQTISSHHLESYRGGYASYTINSLGTIISFVPATFDSYNADGTLNTTGSSTTSSKQARRYIPIGQGYMVKGNATGTLLTSDRHRAYYRESSSNSEFFRSSDTNQASNDNNTQLQPQYNSNGLIIVPSDFKRFRLNVDFDNLYTRQLLHNFHDTATPESDYGLESKIFNPLDSDINWIQNNDALVTQANAYNIDLHIPLELKLATQQSVRIRAFDIQNFNNNQPIYIHDIENNTYVDLRQQNFEINLPSGNYSNRFEVTFQNYNSLSTNEFTDSDFSIIQNNTANELVINNPKAIALKSVTLFDISGKQIFNNTNLDNNTLFTFSTKKLSDGVYVAKIETEAASTMSKKVIITNKK